MLQLLPFLTWLAPATSLAMLVMLASAGELRPHGGAILVSVFVVAAYGQFLSGSAIVGAAGLAMQTLLAIALIVRWRLSA